MAVLKAPGPMFVGPLYSAVGRAQAHSHEEKTAQWRLVKEHLTRLCAHAERRGVRIALEPLNRFETDFINTCAQGGWQWSGM